MFLNHIISMIDQMSCKLYTRAKGICDLDMCKTLICREGKLALDFPGGTSGKEPTCQCRRPKRHRFDP